MGKFWPISMSTNWRHFGPSISKGRAAGDETEAVDIVWDPGDLFSGAGADGRAGDISKCCRPVRGVSGNPLSQRPQPESDSVGTNWTAELWWGPEAIDESQMQPVARALFHESREGFFRGNSSVVVPGTVGGQAVALQIRVWFNAGNTITNWDQALQTMSWPQQTRIIRDYILAGADSNNVPVLGSGNMGRLGLTWQCVVSPPLTDSDFDGLSDAYERGIGRFRVVSTPRMSWHQARDDARNRGGRLASVPTLARWNIIKESVGSLLHGKNLWLGGTDEAVEGQWQWVSGEPWGFTNWRINEPNNDSLGNGRGLPEHHLM
ncbi:MAG: C-type lectin domain-containing protein, partial [Verrucomicrobia bacterium]|nr:C-type lectin domain-containing protein [Verrucomicrobiota bacterium]